MDTVAYARTIEARLHANLEQSSGLTDELLRIYEELIDDNGSPELRERCIRRYTLKVRGIQRQLADVGKALGVVLTELRYLAQTPAK